MALGGTIRPLTIRVIILAVVYQLAMSCEIITMNRIDVLSQFHDLRTDHAAKLINFNISGIEWSDTSNETYEVFDRNLFSWAREDSETLTQLPLDYSILSLGLSRVAIMDILVNISSGCVQGLPFQEQRRLVTLELLKLTNIGKEPLIIADGEACIRDTKDGDKDLICHSVYLLRSPVTGALVGVGKSCCTRLALRSRMYKKCFRHDRPEDFEAKYLAISVIGFLLPFIIIPGAVAWYRYTVPGIRGYGSMDLLKIKVMDDQFLILLGYFKIRQVKPIGQDAVQMRLKENTRLVIDERELEPYEGAVSLFDHLGFMRGVSEDKIKLTLLFLLQYVPVVSWLVYYRSMKDTLLYLNSSEKIIFSLRNNPYSWLWTDSSLWPHHFAIFLVVLNSAPVLPLIVWWLLELPLIRSRLIKCQFRCGLNNPKGILQKMFKIFFCILVICSYITIYSLCNSIIYVIGSLIVSIEIVSSWLTGGFLALYYIQHSYRELVETYTQIKEIMFEQCMEGHIYEATHTKTEESLQSKNKMKIVHVDIIDIRNHSCVYLKPKKFKGPVWFLKHGEHRVYLGISNAMMSKKILFDLCEWIYPIGTGIRKAVVKLAFTLLFLALVVFSINVFLPNAATKEASVLITSMGTLLAALLPRLAEMMGTGAESRIDVAILKSNIKKWLLSDGAHSEFYVIDESKEGETKTWRVSRSTWLHVRIVICAKILPFHHLLGAPKAKNIFTHLITLPLLVPGSTCTRYYLVYEK